MAIRTVYDLKNAHEQAFPNSHYFDPETLKFFGERLSDMYVLKDTVNVKSASGNMHECYVLSKRQKKSDGKYVRRYDYFDIKTLDYVVT